MKNRSILLCVAFIALIANPDQAWAHKRLHTPHHAHRIVHHHAGVDSGAAYSDLVIDAATGRVIHEDDADSLRHPASLTKMMTLYITFQALEAGKLGLGQYVPVSENASYQSPSKLGLHAGQKIRVEDAILGLVTESANDAAVVLGEALGGSEEGFAQMMTKQARALGMSRTVFHNPSGLPDPDQVTTAHDMAVLGDALINHYPQYYPYFNTESFTYAGIYHHNHNHLKDRYDGMDGIKTGYIRASGFNLVASAKRNGVRLVGVVFGGRSAVARDNHMAQLLDNCFDIAASEKRSGRIAAANGEGDGTASDDGDYVTLPAKVSAIFPHSGAAVAETAHAPIAAALPQTAVAQAPASDAAAEPDMQMPAAAAPVATAAQVEKKQVTAAPAQVLVAPKNPQVAMLTPPQAPPSAVSAKNNWGIQIGAYSDAAIGQQALSDLTASMTNLLSGANPQVQKVSAGGTVMYRARLLSLDKKTAQSVCSYLVQRGKSCLTVEP
jgi:D-alanyl-D-alanine carboxypeptidase